MKMGGYTTTERLGAEYAAWRSWVYEFDDRSQHVILKP